MIAVRCAPLIDAWGYSVRDALHVRGQSAIFRSIFKDFVTHYIMYKIRYASMKHTIVLNDELIEHGRPSEAIST